MTTTRTLVHHCLICNTLGMVEGGRTAPVTKAELDLVRSVVSVTDGLCPDNPDCVAVYRKKYGFDAALSSEASC
jgi:hypothetical protein